MSSPEATDPEEYFAEKFERLTGVARRLRRDLSEPDVGIVQREIDLYAYDEVLVSLADMMEVEVPGDVRDEMGPDDRARLEQALAEAGVLLT